MQSLSTLFLLPFFAVLKLPIRFRSPAATLPHQPVIMLHIHVPGVYLQGYILGVTLRYRRSS